MDEQAPYNASEESSPRAGVPSEFHKKDTPSSEVILPKALLSTRLPFHDERACAASSEYANTSSDLRKPLSRAQIIFGHCHKYRAPINLHIVLLPINNYTYSARTYYFQIKKKKKYPS